MTAINLDDQIVATSYDPATRVCSYTYQHTDGARYTVKVPLEEFTRIGTTPSTHAQRRKHLATKLLNHMRSHAPDQVGDDVK
ncbi:MAG: hypothetical protein KGL35_17150 [Bradyrhizobium sp.]|nr:hypothetical protein [Bradyrhizobium sp.]